MNNTLRAGSFIMALLLSLTLIQAASAQTTGAGSEASTASTVSATSSDSEKTIAIEQTDSAFTITEEPETAFWEYPLLPAGQQREGTLTIVNESEKKEEFSLTSIELPYTDKEALTYLASLHITVSQTGGGVLYDGLYSGIAEDNGLKIDQLTLQPGESQKFQITVRCAFNYGGDPSQTTSRITWHVKASNTSSVTSHAISGAVKVILVIVVIALLGAGVVLAFFQKKHAHK